MIGNKGDAYTFVRQRFMGIQANTSPLSYAELDNAADLFTTEPMAFADEMLSLHNYFGIKILGGCCGTDSRHMEQTAQRLAASSFTKAQQ